jgi:hypothetical protein
MDAHHVQLLSGLDLLYVDSSDLTRIVERQISAPASSIELKSRVEAFQNHNVALRFRQEFLH